MKNKYRFTISSIQQIKMYTHTVLRNTLKKTNYISVLIYSSYFNHTHFLKVGLKSTHCQYLPFKGTKLI